MGSLTRRWRRLERARDRRFAAALAETARRWRERDRERLEVALMSGELEAVTVEGGAHWTTPPTSPLDDLEAAFERLGLTSARAGSSPPRPGV